MILRVADRFAWVEAAEQKVSSHRSAGWRARARGDSGPRCDRCRLPLTPHTLRRCFICQKRFGWIPKTKGR